MGERTYSDRRKHADRFAPKQLAIVASLFPKEWECRISTETEDMGGVDCWIGEKRIALRIRFNAHYNDITIRHNELQKLKQGSTDYMLYCTAEKRHDTDSENLTGWKLIDLAAIRRAGEDWFSQVKYEDRTAANGDRFWLFDIDTLEANYGPAVVASGSVEIEQTTSTDTEGNITTIKTQTVTRTIHPSFYPDTPAIVWKPRSILDDR